MPKAWLRRARLKAADTAALVEFLGFILLVLGLFAVWLPLGFLGAGILAIILAQGMSNDTAL